MKETKFKIGKYYEECKTEIANQYGYLTWIELKDCESVQTLENTLEEVAKTYAKHVAEDLRRRCYDNSLTFDDKGILETEIILP